MTFSALFSCAEPAEAPARALAEALASVAARPRAAATTCAAVAAPRWRGDCLIAAVERLAAKDVEAASALCAQVPRPEEADECWFQLAERSHRPDLCARAGRFAEDCRLHGWVNGLGAWLPARPSADPAAPAPAWAEAVVSAGRIAATKAGFSQDDPRPWTALFRQVQAGAPAPDPRLCGDFAPMGLEATCAEAGLGVLRDRLRYGLDTGALRCGGLREEALQQGHPDWRAAIEALASASGCAHGAPQ